MCPSGQRKYWEHIIGSDENAITTVTWNQKQSNENLGVPGHTQPNNESGMKDNNPKSGRSQVAYILTYDLNFWRFDTELTIIL